MAEIYREQAAPEPLARWVECLWWLETGDGIAGYPVAPDGCLDILYSPEGGLRVIGAMTAERRFDLSPGSRTIGIRFLPGMAGSFLQAPPAELTDRDAPLDDLWGARGRELAGRLAEARSAPEGLRLLAAALRTPAHRPDVVGQAIEAITRSHGAIDLNALALRANLSPRQFRRRCLEASGLAPKQLCRVMRFRHARQLAARPGRLKWAQVSLEAGYYDQAHLIRDFRGFTGRAPGGPRLSANTA